MAFTSHVFRRSVNFIFICNNYGHLSSPLTSKLSVNRFYLQRRHKSVSWSYSHRGGTTPLTSATIIDTIDDVANDYGHIEAVVNSFQGIRKTFSQYIDDINKFAAGLLALDLDVGDRMGIWSPNCYEWMVAQHAATKAGLILVPINPAYQTPEVDYCIRKVGLKAMVIYDRFKTQDYHQMLTQLMPEISSTKPGNKIKNKNHPYFETLITMTNNELPGTFKFDDVFQASNSNDKAKLDEVKSKMTMEKPVYIMFTSGTTGKPKGVVLSHHSLVNSSIVYSRNEFGFEPNKCRSCLVVPLFHAIGAVSISLNNLILGQTVVVTGPTHNPALALKSIQEEKCTELIAPATIYVDMLNHPDSAKTDFSSLNRLKMGGSLCPPPLLSRLREEWKCDIVMTGYGSTEVASGACTTQANYPLNERLNTCGRPFEYLEFKIVDSNGDMVPRGQPGEIYIRGYKVMLGYWGEEDKTREAITVDGWYRSGDVGIMLENGCFQIVDRIRDMIIRGGENVYPKEIENFLMEHPKILEAHVIGVPDERMGEEICVWVQCRRGETLTTEELRAFCKRKISHFKIPRIIRFVEEFPKTLTGKVQKNIMRENESKRLINSRSSAARI